MLTSIFLGTWPSTKADTIRVPLILAAHMHTLGRLEDPTCVRGPQLAHSRATDRSHAAAELRYANARGTEVGSGQTRTYDTVSPRPEDVPGALATGQASVRASARPQPLSVACRLPLQTRRPRHCKQQQCAVAQRPARCCSRSAAALSGRRRPPHAAARLVALVELQARTWSRTAPAQPDAAP